MISYTLQVNPLYSYIFGSCYPVIHVCFQLIICLFRNALILRPSAIHMAKTVGSDCFFASVLGDTSVPCSRALDYS